VLNSQWDWGRFVHFQIRIKRAHTFEEEPPVCGMWYVELQLVMCIRNAAVETSMPVLRILGRKCTLAASLAAPLVQWHDPTFSRNLAWTINNHLCAFFNSF